MTTTLPMRSTILAAAMLAPAMGALPAQPRSAGNGGSSCLSAPVHRHPGADTGQRYLVDSALGHMWAILPNEEHPAGPARAVRIPSVGKARENTPSGPGQLIPAVRAGMKVHFWIDSASSRMDLAGTALGSACLGDRVRVKLAATSATVEGKVTAPATVEAAFLQPTRSTP
jgi:hypothetical protein